MFRRFVILLCFIAFADGLWFYFSTKYPATSPIKSLFYLGESLFQPHTTLKKEVIGFIPYWRLDQSSTIHPNELSEINYFSLSVGYDGHLLQVVNGQNDPGWNGWIKQSTKDFLTKSQIMGAKVTLTIAAQDNQLIEALMDDTKAQDQMIADILDQVKRRGLDGVNIDFEYTGEPPALYKQEFTIFSNKLNELLKRQKPDATLSLSIMPLSARNKDLYDFPAIAQSYDRFIGMSYDYYGQSSDIAGPVAPMNGFKQGKYFFDVSTTYADYLKYLPKNKIVMGIPTYGWEWAVLDGKTMASKTFAQDDPNSYAAVISYARAREDTDIKPTQCHWDNISEETWCWFTDKKSGVDHQAWIADNQMIQTRFDYANQQNFDGIALWTLGLDKNYPDIWDRIQSSFGKP